MRYPYCWPSVMPVAAWSRSSALAATLAVTLAGSVAGCASLPMPGAVTEIQVLHMADVDGNSGALGNVRAFSALVEQFRAQYPDNTLMLSSGDNVIPGPRYFAAADDSMAALLGVPGNGRGDTALLNALGVQASTVGNHELDLGPESFAGQFAAATAEESDATFAGADFPYVSTNLDYSAEESLAPLIGPDAAPAGEVAGKLVRSTVLGLKGERVGIVGATTPNLNAITSTGAIAVSPANGDDLDALAEIIQGPVDELLAQGIDKIILLAHMQQLAIEQQLATRLSGVDLIIGGGSNTLLADDDDPLRPGDSASDTYPLEYESATGEPVLLVNVDGDYKYLGRIVLPFDRAGILRTDALDATKNGAWATTDEVAAALQAEPSGAVVELADALETIMIEHDSDIVGQSSVYLDGRRTQVRTQETNLGNLTADANLWLAQQADPTVRISLKNGGGIRSDIGLVLQPPGTTDPADAQFLPPQANELTGKQEGEISRFDLQGSLRFNNELTLLTLTATELRDVLEHAVAATEEGATPGQFPQVAGLQFSFDPAQQARVGGDTNGGAEVAGKRLRNLAVVDTAGAVTDVVLRDGVIEGDPERPFRIVTLNFIAKCVIEPSEECGDGYPYKGLGDPQMAELVTLAPDPGQSDFAEPGSEQDALAEYLTAFYSISPYTLAESALANDTRIQNLSARTDSVLLPN